MTYPSVAIIVLTWNGRDLTLDCLASLRQLDYGNYQTVVVDNGSVDGTTDAVRLACPEVTVIDNRRNLGFAEGNNVGIRWALDQGFEYVMLLNNDTTVDQEMLRSLIGVAEADPQIGVVGPLIYYADRPDVIWNAGNVIDWQTLEFRHLYANERNSHPCVPYAVDYVAGTAFCIKRPTIQAAGLLDHRYFFYFEETDWCLAARQVGFKVVVMPQSRIWHKVSATIKEDSPATTYYMTRNLLLFLESNLTGRHRLRALALASLRELRAVSAHSLKPRYRHLRAHRDARILALRDALLGRWGAMGHDVARVCYPRRVGPS